MASIRLKIYRPDMNVAFGLKALAGGEHGSHCRVLPCILSVRAARRPGGGAADWLAKIDPCDYTVVT